LGKRPKRPWSTSEAACDATPGIGFSWTFDGPEAAAAGRYAGDEAAGVGIGGAPGVSAAVSLDLCTVMTCEQDLHRNRTVSDVIFPSSNRYFFPQYSHVTRTIPPPSPRPMARGSIRTRRSPVASTAVNVGGQLVKILRGDARKARRGRHRLTGAASIPLVNSMSRWEWASSSLSWGRGLSPPAVRRPSCWAGGDYPLLFISKAPHGGNGAEF
jgi:hypothetical protein